MFLLELVLEVVELVFRLVPRVCFSGYSIFDIDQGTVFLSSLDPENFDFVLQDLDSFLQLGQLLTGVSDLLQVLVPLVLDLFVESDQRIQLKFCLLLLLHEIHNEQFFYLELFFGLSPLGRGLGSSSGHFLPDRAEELNLFEPLIGLVLEDLCLLF